MGMHSAPGAQPGAWMGNQNLVTVKAIVTVTATPAMTVTVTDGVPERFRGYLCSCSPKRNGAMGSSWPHTRSVGWPSTGFLDGSSGRSTV